MVDEGKAHGEFDRQHVYRSLYLHMVEGVALHELVCDKAGAPINYRILDANPQFRRYVGAQGDRIVGKLATEAFGTPTPPYLAELAGVALGGQPLRFETHFEPFDRFYDISVVPLGSGQFATIFLDISERKRNERALRESEWFLRRSQRLALIGSYRFNIATGTWTNSEALNDIFGIGPDYQRDVAGWLALVHPHDREAMHDYLMGEVISGGGEFDRHYRIVRASDGAVRWVHGMGDLERDAEGKPVSMIGIIQDATESMLREQA